MTEEKKAQKPTAPTNSSLLVAIIGLIIAIIALAAAIFLWIQPRESNELNNQIDSLKVQLQSKNQLLEDELQQQQKSLMATQTSVSNLAKASIDLKRQRTLSQIAYLIQLANLHLTVNHDTNAGLRLLNSANERLNSVDDSNLFTLKHALLNDITALKNVPKLNITDTVVQLDQLSQQINKLHPIPSKLKATETTTPITTNENLAWYKKLENALSGLKDLIVIRRINTPIQPLLTPDQLAMLKENCRLKLIQAQWAVMHHNETIYKNSLNQVSRWIQLYFHDQTSVDDVNNAIVSLQKLDVSPTIPSIDNSIAAVNELENGSNYNVKNNSGDTQ